MVVQIPFILNHWANTIVPIPLDGDDNDGNNQ